MLAVEAPRFGKGSGAKEDSSPASIASAFILDIFDKKCQYFLFICHYLLRRPTFAFFGKVRKAKSIGSFPGMGEDKPAHS